MTLKKLIRVSEYSRSPIPLSEDEKFSNEEIDILERVLQIHSDYI